MVLSGDANFNLGDNPVNMIPPTTSYDHKKISEAVEAARTSSMKAAKHPSSMRMSDMAHDASIMALKQGTGMAHELAGHAHKIAAEHHGKWPGDEDDTSHAAASDAHHTCSKCHHECADGLHCAGFSKAQTADDVLFTFTLPPEAVDQGRWVKYTAPIAFRAGKYDEINFEISDAELAKAVADFKAPINLDLEHKNSLLDGQLGSLHSVKMNPDGKTATADFFLPKWLHAMVPGPKGVSLQFGRAAKNIKGCALTVNPRVEDAQMLAAFAQDTGVNGSMPVPMTDMARPTLHGKALFQMVHDQVKKAHDEAQADTANVYSNNYKKGLAKMLESCQAFGATTSDTAGDSQLGGSASMSKEEEAKMKALEAEVAELRVTNAANRKKAIEAEAASFAREELRHRAYRVEYDKMVNTYIAMAEADDANFSATKKAGTLLEMYKAACASRPKHNLLTEAMPDADFARTTIPGSATTTPAANPNAPPSKERIDALLNATELGQRVAAQKKVA